MQIGHKIKELRIQKNLTQEELADRAELSKGFISQLERDLTSPSIATLVDILQCLGTNLEEFFSNTTSEQVVFHKSDYFEKYDSELKNEIQWIIPNAQKNMMEPILLTLEPEGSTYRITHMKGRIRLRIKRKYYHSYWKQNLQSKERRSLLFYSE